MKLINKLEIDGMSSEQLELILLSNARSRLIELINTQSNNTSSKCLLKLAFSFGGKKQQLLSRKVSINANEEMSQQDKHFLQLSQLVLHYKENQVDPKILSEANLILKNHQNTPITLMILTKHFQKIKNVEEEKKSLQLIEGLFSSSPDIKYFLIRTYSEDKDFFNAKRINSSDTNFFAKLANIIAIHYSSSSAVRVIITIVIILFTVLARGLLIGIAIAVFLIVGLFALYKRNYAFVSFISVVLLLFFLGILAKGVLLLLGINLF